MFFTFWELGFRTQTFLQKITINRKKIVVCDCIKVIVVTNFLYEYFL